MLTSVIFIDVPFVRPVASVSTGRASYHAWHGCTDNLPWQGRAVATHEVVGAGSPSSCSIHGMSPMSPLNQRRGRARSASGLARREEPRGNHQLFGESRSSSGARMATSGVHSCNERRSFAAPPNCDRAGSSHPRAGTTRPCTGHRPPLREHPRACRGRLGDLEVSVIESFWGGVQTELLNRRWWKTRIELANALFEYFEIFHNRRRRHSALGMLTPIEYERLHHTTATA